MIHLTRLNDRPFVVNADLIKLIENAPDTVITLLNGEKLVVKEPIHEILARVEDFHQRSARRIHSHSFSAPSDEEAAHADHRQTLAAEGKSC
jgi:flagellar protein FlbD